MNMIPTQDRVIIKPIEQEETVAGLEIVRDQKNREMSLGIVIAAGPEAPFKEEGDDVINSISSFLNWLLRIKRKPYIIGQKVFFSPAAGTVIRRLCDNGEWESLRIMHADTLQCIIDESV